MQVGQLYSCKWGTLSRSKGTSVRGWDMLMFLGTQIIHRSDGVVVTNYRFYDALTGETRIFDKGLIRHCKPLDKEEKCIQ